MTLGLERTPAPARVTESLEAGAERLSRPLSVFRSVYPRVLSWVRRQPPVRFISSSLLRRILISNLLGLAVLLFGILYLSLTSGWLITAKRQSLETQGKIIAAAIAADAKITVRDLVLDPNKLPEAEDSRAPFRDDAFTALELSIKPEQVAPVLRRLIEPTNTRARVYDREGILIVDSAALLSRGQLVQAKTDNSKFRPKNFWTRLTHWLSDRQLPVYKEIGNSKGTYYPEVRAALTGTPTPMLLLNERGEQIVSVAVPIQRLKSVQGVLLLSTRPGEIDEILAEERQMIWILALSALVASIVTSFLLARTVAGPMHRLSETADLVSRNINARQELPDYSDRYDEVGRMARAFKAMTAALYRRIEASEKFAADVAHELKNPLTAARSTAEALSYAKTDEQRNELVHQIENEIKRLSNLVTDVSSISRLDAELARQQLEPVPIIEVIENVAAVFRDKLAERGCSLKVDLPERTVREDLVVMGNDSRLGQVVTNLVDNAISFSPEGGRVSLSALRAGDQLELNIEDQGPGIDEDKLATIFERFYTYRPTAEGSRGDNSGLGLSISQEIVRAHGGDIWAENRYARSDPTGKRIGARFIVRLPLAKYGAHPLGASSGPRR